MRARAPFAPLLVFGLSLGLAGLCSAPAPAWAQDDREAEYSLMFTRGLEAITRRDLDTSEKLFLACIKVFPDRPVAHYNLACTYSLREDAPKAVAALRESFRLGYRDLAHMQRDMDLDPIRRTPAFRAAMTELEDQVLSAAAEPLSHVPSGAAADEQVPVFVFLHDQGAQADAALARLQRSLPEAAVLAPRGQPVGGGPAHQWGDWAEFLVVRVTRQFLELTPAADRRKVFLLAEGAVAPLAVSIAAHHPELFSGVLASGPGLDRALSGDVEPSGMRAYLVVPQEDRGAVEAGRGARDAFAAAGSPVILERYPARDGLARDRALLLRATRWLLGDEVRLPSEGRERTF